jgi:hypothetical protein
VIRERWSTAVAERVWSVDMDGDAVPLAVVWSDAEGTGRFCAAEGERLALAASRVE